MNWKKSQVLNRGIYQKESIFRVEHYHRIGINLKLVDFTDKFKCLAYLRKLNSIQVSLGKTLMSTPANSSYCWQDVLTQHDRLNQFKARLSASVKVWLEACEWTLIAEAGQQKMPLLVLRCPERLRLRDPRLLALAESAHSNWGPLDLSLFSAETTEPVRVFSKTIIDINRHR